MKTTKYTTDREIVKLVEQKTNELLEICQMYKLPMYCTVAINNTESTTEYRSVVHNAKSHNLILADDKIKQHMLISGGFKAIPPRECVELTPMDFINDE